MMPALKDKRLPIGKLGLTGIRDLKPKTKNRLHEKPRDGQVRVCLRCDREFLSFGNRVCQRCHDINDGYAPDAEGY